MYSLRMIDNARVGALIKSSRKKAGLTLDELRDALPGVSKSRLSRIERGEQGADDETLAAIAEALGIDLFTMWQVKYQPGTFAGPDALNASYISNKLRQIGFELLQDDGGFTILGVNGSAPIDAEALNKLDDETCSLLRARVVEVTARLPGGPVFPFADKE